LDADVDPKKNRKAVTYQYDATGQVTTGAAATYSYNGTRREKVVVQDGDKTKEFDYVYGKSNEILSDGRYTYQYDLSGNRIKKEQIKSEVIDGERQNKEWSYRFDALGRVTEVVEYNRRTQLALTSTFRYDALGRLVSTFASQATKTNGTANVVERYVYDGANVYIDLAGNFGAPVTTAAARYLRGDTTDDIVGRFSSAESRLYLTDRLGSVRNVITKSATADYATLVTYTYETFGARQAVDKKGDRIAPADVKGPWDRYGYTGRELDRLSGLQHNRARWYDSWTGQWLSQDPIGFAGGDTNLYRYVGNDPVNKTDPSGRLAHVVVTAAVGTVIGGLVGGIGTYLETGDLSEAAGAAARGALVGFVSGTAAGLTGGASLLVSGAVGAAAGNIVSQGIEVADGKRDSFSWKEFGVQTVTGAIGAGIGGGIGKGLSKLTGINVAGQAACRQAIAQQVVRSVNGAAGGFVGDGVTQLGMIGAGLQKEFNWTQSILAAAGGAAGELMTYRMTRACFTAGTPLLTPSGAKPIEQFQVGDVLFSRDEHNLEGPVEPKVVEEVFIRHAPVLFLHIGGRRIGTTGEHPFWVRDKGWLPANQIVAGDHLVGHDNQWIVVHAVEATDEYQTVYNLRIADHHTYFVGKEEWGWSVWAHNSNICILGTPEEVVAQDRVSALLIPLEAHIEAHPTSWHRTGQPSGIKRNGAFSISEVRTAQDTHELLVSMNGPGRTNDMWQQIIREEFGLVHEQSINDDGLTLRFVRDELPVPTDTRLNDAEMHIARVATREGSEMLAIGATRNTCMFCQHRLLFSYNLPRNRIITPFNEHTAGAPRDFYDALGHSLPKNQQDFHGSEG
ncbi:MAG TPA: RHS repeat-associated core domain-containing protein, partial [Gemmata sp.]